jgi:hypothetical protein
MRNPTYSLDIQTSKQRGAHNLNGMAAHLEMKPHAYSAVYKKCI